MDGSDSTFETEVINPMINSLETSYGKASERNEVTKESLKEIMKGIQISKVL